MDNKELQEITQMHEDYRRYEGAIHGGTGTGLQMCYSYQDGHDEFCEWLIDGFGGFIDDIAQLQADNSRLAAQLKAYSPFEPCDFKGMEAQNEKLKEYNAEITKLKKHYYRAYKDSQAKLAAAGTAQCANFEWRGTDQPEAQNGGIVK